MSKSARSSLLFAVSVAIACSSSSSGNDAPDGSAGVSGSCELSSGAAHTCDEYAGLSAAQVDSVKNACAAGGTWRDGGCDRANTVGGCKETVGGVETTIWYYAGGGQTADAVQQACAAAKGTFLDGTDGGDAGPDATGDSPGTCAPGGAPCTTFGECCSGTCAKDVCTSCNGAGSSCTSPDDCCKGLSCSSDKCLACSDVGADCKLADACCSGICSHGTCAAAADAGPDACPEADADACGTCVVAKCGLEYGACNGDSTCSSAFSCVEKCDRCDATCIDGCVAEGGGSGSPIDTLVKCMRTQCSECGI